MRARLAMLVAWVTALLATRGALAEEVAAPHIVGHRGLIRHAPENTLAAFAACLELRLGFEVDVRRSADGVLVCVHDADLKRTTDGEGQVAELPLSRLKDRDAGGRFDPAFRGERIPTLDEVLALVRRKETGRPLVAIDLKGDDEALEADVVRLAQKHGVLDRLVFIGRTISEPQVRRKLRAASRDAQVAILAQGPEDVGPALEEETRWVYVRFLPTREQVARIHAAGRKVFLAGPTVAGREPAGWGQARQAGVDALLTDYPLECRESWRASPSRPGSPGR